MAIGPCGTHLPLPAKRGEGRGEGQTFENKAHPNHRPPSAIEAMDKKFWILASAFWILKIGVQRHAGLKNGVQHHAAKEKRPDTTPASIENKCS